MVMRKIVHINEEKCNGCGLCIPTCHEGAMQIINGKAKLLAENLCDGLGDCLGECPQGAIEIIEREADEYDEIAVKERQKMLEAQNIISDGCPGSKPQFFGCPGSRVESPGNEENLSEKVNINSELRQWPVQLHLVPITAPFFQDKDLLIAADCVPVAYPNFHQELLKDKAVAIACPKLDNTSSYAAKLADIIKTNNIKSVTIARMEVPCCGGLKRIVQQAIEASGVNIPVIDKVIGIRGNILK